MLSHALAFSIFAIIAVPFGFGGITSAGIGQIVCGVLMVWVIGALILWLSES